MVPRRSAQPRNDQLPHLPPRARRSLLREDLRTDAGLGMRVRKVQAHQEQGHDLRPLRRRGHALVRAPPAHGAHRAGRPGQPHLVLQMLAFAHGASARQDDGRARARHLLSGLDRCRARRHAAQGRPDSHRPGEAGCGREIRRGLPRRDGRFRHSQAPAQPGSRPSDGRARRGDGEHALQTVAQENRQAHEGCRGLPFVEVEPRVDGAGRAAGHSAGVAPARSPGRRQVRDLRSERSLPPRHKPQQPPAQSSGAQDAGRDHPQREAHAAGGCRRRVRQRAPRPRRDGAGQPRAQVAVRDPQGQDGALPPEPAGQARGLLGPFGHCRRPGAQVPAVRHPEGNGASPVRAVHYPSPEGAGHLPYGPHGAQDDRAPGREGLGYSRRGDEGQDGVPEPRADAAPPFDPGVRARPGRRQGDSPAPDGLHAVQRGLRRRPDGRPCAALDRGAARVEADDAGVDLHLLPGFGQVGHDADAGRLPRAVLPYGPVPARQARREDRGQDGLFDGASAAFQRHRGSRIRHRRGRDRLPFAHPLPQPGLRHDGPSARCGGQAHDRDHGRTRHFQRRVAEGDGLLERQVLKVHDRQLDS